MKQDATNIILCGGPINYTNLPVGTNLSNAMIPVNGKPVIGWILDDLLRKGITQATVVLREQDRRLQSFLQQAYSGRMELACAPLSGDGTILQSLNAGLRRSPTAGLVRIILGDTLIRDSYEAERDFVYVGSVEDSRRWCIAVTGADDRVIDYLDKQAMSSETRKALAGYYHLTHGDYLRSCVKQSVANGERELSSALKRYGAVYPIEARGVKEWYDFGHIDNLVDARRRLLTPRYFNSLTINPVLNTITKISDHNDKLRDELDWFLNIPDDLKVLTPRIIRCHTNNGHLEVVQEYYGYPTLAELYVYGDLIGETWISILRHVFRIHAEFRRFSGKLAPEAVEAVYVDKTIERLNAIREQDSYWNDLLSRDEVVFNDKPLRGFGVLTDGIRRRTRSLAQTAQACVVHGDFCFSNILFDVNSQIIRLIDPRGSFGTKGIYGDPRYDIAKLRHSACGLYDYIIADMFELSGENGEFRGQVYVNGTPKAVGSALDRMIVEAGYDAEEIRFVEGLLFVSMLPLHRGHSKRQEMMFLTGLSLLNQVL